MVGYVSVERLFDDDLRTLEVRLSELRYLLHSSYHIKSLAKKYKQSSDEFIKTAISKLPENIFWVDRQGRLQGTNENHARQVGVDPRQALGQDPFTLADKFGWVSSMPYQIRRNDFDVMESGEARVFYEIAEIKGRKHSFLSCKAPLRDEEDAIVGVLGLSIDISHLE